MAMILSCVLYLGLLVHIGLLAVVRRLVWRGEEVIDRPMGADVLGTPTLSIVVTLAAIEWDSNHIHVAVG